MKTKNLQNSSKLFFFITLVFLSEISSAVSRYWVGSGNWTTTNLANWSATSGGTGGQSVPTSADDVFFSASSGSCSILINADIKSLTLTGGTISFGGTTGQYSFRIRGDYSKTAGTLNFDAANAAFFDVDGNFTHTSNTFYAPLARNMYIGGSYVRTGGSFEHNGGTLIFDGNTSTLDLNISETFNNLIITKTDTNSLNIASTDLIVAMGSVSFTNGRLSGGSLQTEGNVTVGSSWDGGNTLLKFVGANLQTFTLTGAESLFQGSLEIAKTGYSLLLGSDLRMIGVGQSITLTSGYLKLNSKTLTLFNSTNLTGTTYGNGTLTIIGPGTYNTYNFSHSLPGNIGLSSAPLYHIYNNLNLFGSSSAIFNSTSGNLLIDGNYSQSSGKFFAPLGTMSLGGNFIHTGGTFDHSSGTVEFIGNNSTLTAPNTISLNSIKINKNAGNALSINTGSSMTLGKKLTLTEGIINTTVWSQLILLCNVEVSMANSSNFCSATSYVNGPMSEELCSSGTLFFPIGRNGNCRPMTLTTIIAGTTNFTAEQIEDEIPNWCLPADICSVSKKRHFRITLNNGEVFKDPIKLSYCTDDGVTNLNDVDIAKQVGNCWKNLAGTGTANNIGTITSVVDFTTYGDFILASRTCLNPLPVKLITFKSIKKAASILLIWRTASEIDNDRFEVERSFDGKIWIKIGMVKGHGTSNKISEYNFEDIAIPALHKDMYYRLKQVDFNGKFEFSPMVVESFNESNIGTTDIAIYPNPVSNIAILENKGTHTIDGYFEIQDICGRRSFTNSFFNYTTIDLTTFQDGLYFIKVYNRSGKLISTQKIILRR